MDALNLADAGILKSFLARHGLSATKGLGQHFLVSSAAVRAILGAAEGCKGILEIGPGPGVLTGPLSRQAERLIALELDSRMAEALKESAPRAEVLPQDALRADLGALLQSLPEPRGIVSNMPYYITGPLLQLVAEHSRLIDRAVLMMQKEVAERVVARERTPMRGSLSVYLQSVFQIAGVAKVPAGAFLPPPKVDSAVLLFKPKLGQAHPNLYFKAIRLGFSQPRKTLANNLASAFHIERAVALEAILAAGLGEKCRPQELSLEEWERLAGQLDKTCT